MLLHGVNQKSTTHRNTLLNSIQSSSFCAAFCSPHRWSVVYGVIQPMLTESLLMHVSLLTYEHKNDWFLFVLQILQKSTSIIIPSKLKCFNSKAFDNTWCVVFPLNEQVTETNRLQVYEALIIYLISFSMLSHFSSFRFVFLLSWHSMGC